MSAYAVEIKESITSKSEKAITAIMAAMQQYEVTTIGCSYGKDSSCVLALTLEAARRLKTKGIHRPVIVLTADTGVENPSMIKLAHKMADQMLTFATEHGLDVSQRWVQPSPMDHYLVQMIGGRSTASVPGTSASCTVDLKIRPMEKVRAELSAQYGAENILTLIGTRFDESAHRAANMRERDESDTIPRIQDSGSALLSPIAHWTVGDVWALLNAGERQIAFPMLDFTSTLAVYEMVGESTCSIGAIDPQFKQQSGGCGSAGRTGCWACQRVTRDSSLESMLEQMPAYGPLVQLSRSIRAGHYLPENRTYLGKSVQDGKIRVFANGYSPRWTAQLLKWTLSIDMDEDDRAARTGKARRFPRLLTEEHLILIAFLWSRYGLHAPGEFIRIYDAVATGTRYALPTDQKLANMEARADTSLVGKTLGWINTDTHLQDKPVFRDSWRDLLGESACSVPVLEGARRYRAGSGAVHDSLVYSDGVEASVEHLRNPDGSFGIVFQDFMWWYAMDFAQGNKSHAEELRWLLREGVIRARPGYQSKIAQYIQFSNLLADVGLQNASLEEIRYHPAFEVNGESSEQITLTLVA